MRIRIAILALGTFAIGTDGTVWATTHEGILQFQNNTWIVVDAVSDYREVVVAPNGEVWFSLSDRLRSWTDGKATHRATAIHWP